MSVIVATEGVHPPTELTLDASEETVRGWELQLLAGTLGAPGVTAALVANTALVVTLAPGHGRPADQAAQAARCALVIKQRWRDATVTLASAHAGTGTHPPAGEAIDRAWALLAAPHARDRSSVYIDDPTAGLLDTRFELGLAADGGHRLHGERASRPPT